MWQCGCGFGILGLCICIITWLQPGEKPHIHDVLQAASCSWKPCWEKWTWYVGWQQQGLDGSLLEAAWGTSRSCCLLAQNNAKGCTETCREGGESVNSREVNRDLADWHTGLEQSAGTKLLLGPCDLTVASACKIRCSIKFFCSVMIFLMQRTSWNIPWGAYSCSAIQENLQFLELWFWSPYSQQPVTISLLFSHLYLGLFLLGFLTSTFVCISPLPCALRACLSQPSGSN